MKALENNGSVAIHAQFIPASSSVTGGDTSLISANEPMLYVEKSVNGGVCATPSTNSIVVAGVPSASAGCASPAPAAPLALTMCES